MHARDPSRPGSRPRKDAYDIYYCIRNYGGGPEALAGASCHCSIFPIPARDFWESRAKFAHEDMIGPVWVRQFVEGTTAIDERTPEQWQLDASVRSKPGCMQWAR